MVQALEVTECAECGEPTYELCDWCAFLSNLAHPVCPEHSYTRFPWNGERHTLCAEHEELLRQARAALQSDRGEVPIDWRSTEAYEYEPYLLAAKK